jgi:putative transferase (TIGR04331 family)
MSNILCLSPFTFHKDLKDKCITMAGDWCLSPEVVDSANKYDIKYKVHNDRLINESQFSKEADDCFDLYQKYIEILSENLNVIHNENFSIRYWGVLLNSFLYRLIASIIDHDKVLIDISNTTPNLFVEILDTNRQWYDQHVGVGGASRIFHLVIYSLVIKHTEIFNHAVIDSHIIINNIENFGDGKKSLKKNRKKYRSYILSSIKKYIIIVTPFISGKLNIVFFKFFNAKVLLLGDQYLPKNAIKILLNKVKSLPFYAYSNKLETAKFIDKDIDLRSSIVFPKAESKIERAIQESIILLLPTIFLENYKSIAKRAEKYTPCKKITILDSMHCEGSDFINFIVARSIELYNSHYVIVCHGGCFGVMKISVKERIWSTIADTYAIWSKKMEGENLSVIKMPSLRFYRHRIERSSDESQKPKKVLVFLSGYYPYRYAYDSIFPLTIDPTHKDCNLNFFSSLSLGVLPDIVARDFHNSERLKKSNLTDWFHDNNINVDMDKSTLFQEAMKSAKLTVHTTPQTTYLESIICNKPTVCFWNPDVNIIRDDLLVYFEGLEKVGVIHHTPESAAKHINTIYDNPLEWWNSKEVVDAVENFKDGVCYTSNDTLKEWADFISNPNKK